VVDGWAKLQVIFERCETNPHRKSSQDVLNAVKICSRSKIARFMILCIQWLILNEFVCLLHKFFTMASTLLIEITNQKALGLLHELEELHLIKVLKNNVIPPKIKLSDKYRGVFTKEDAQDFDNHTQQMRNEWNNI
jgi:hypothetical protein